MRNTKALIYDPYGHGLKLTKAHAKHVKGARVNKGAKKVALHAFVQFPTDLEITPENEQMMLDQAVAFVNEKHGGKAVFHARLDRDEKGRHGVDVFFAPKYDKTTAKGTEAWVSLSKFGADLAHARLGQVQAEKFNKKTEKWVKQFNDDGTPKMVWQDSPFFIGRVMQDEWFEHLRDECGIDWVQRGEQKIGRDKDRLEVEEYKTQQETKKHEELSRQIEGLEREIERLKDKAANHERLAEKHRVTAEENDDKAEKAARNAEIQERRAEDAHRAAESLTERLEGLRSTETRLTASVERLEALKASMVSSTNDRIAELAGIEDAVAQKKTKIAALRARLSSLNAA